MAKRYICVHGHFYQPPRENPWLEAIELQDSAYPYHDWNERITAECYETNGVARILNDAGKIERIVNNYARMSFNFGPTLLQWMEDRAPEAYAAVLEADRLSLERFGGHGSAMAQAYNHLIMPLANERDRRTQVIWGIRDFEDRFGRAPKGMWLPETAVDLPTLELLAEFAIDFTILAPRQAHRVRPLGAGEDDWADVTGGKIDPTRAYRQQLPSGKQISLFFYDGPISQAIAFEGLLNRGDLLASRLLGAFNSERDWAQLVHIATDGETYGHHHRNGEMALAWALARIEREDDVELANYGSYLEANPPEYEVEIYEDSSWSCIHGVERWRADCGCNTGGHPAWNQAWRGPLRDALDWIRDGIAPHYEEQAGLLLKDPWAARNAYIQVILDRDPDNLDDFLLEHAKAPLGEQQTRRVLKLLELQRHALLMYTSCGWFFDELSGIETTQVIMYAGRALQLAAETLGEDLESGFIQRLEGTPSNLPAIGNGRVVYERFIRPAAVTLPKVGAHYAISSLFEEYERLTQIHAYQIELVDSRRDRAGEAGLLLGRARVTSLITRDTMDLGFGLLHFGDHNLTCGVREYQGEEAYERMASDAGRAFSRADLPEVLRSLDRDFGELTYSLRSLFRDEQRKVLNSIMESAIAEAEGAYRSLYEHHAPLLYFLSSLGMPGPSALRAPTEFVVNSDLRQSLALESFDRQRALAVLETAERGDLPLDSAGLAFTYQGTLEQLALQLHADPRNLDFVRSLTEAASLVRKLPFDTDLVRTQNRYYEILQSTYPAILEKAAVGDAVAEEWRAQFQELGEYLWIEVPESSSNGGH